MKKLYIVLVLSALSVSSMMHAWYYTFTNETDSPVHVRLTYAGYAGTQGPFQLASTEKRTFNSLIECLKKVEVWPHNTANKTTYYPPSTGLGIDCSSGSFAITQDANGKLVVRPQ